MHFFNPVPIMKAVEIISTSQTSDETAATVTKVGEKAGKVTGQVAAASETYGFIVNRIFAAARAEAQSLVVAEIATEEDIDRMMVGGRNWPVGFFGERGGIGQQW